MTGRASKGTGRGSGELVIFRFLFCFWLGKYVYSMTIQVVYLWCMCFSSMNDAYNLKIKSFFKKKIYLCRIFIKDKVEFKVIFFRTLWKLTHGLLAYSTAVWHLMSCWFFCLYVSVSTFLKILQFFSLVFLIWSS